MSAFRIMKVPSKFSLIICTYQRPESLIKLLESVTEQVLYPNEILVIDGSKDEETKKALQSQQFKALKYFLVDDTNRGLTRQRNFGISKVAEVSEIVCFLDDDVILTPPYFQNLIGSYNTFPDAVGVGGYILNEVTWKKKEREEIKSDE